MICSGCVKKTQLKKFVLDKGYLGQCNYCEQIAKGVERATLFDHILDLVNINIATRDDLSDFELGMIYHGGSDEIAVQDIGIVLSEWFELGEEPYIDDLMAYLPEEYKKDEDGSERHYFFDDGNLEQNIYEEKWERFVTDVRYSHRFFNPNARKFLDSVFSMLTVDDGNLKPEIIRLFRKGDLLYRARIAQTYEAAEKIEASPDKELGPTPRDKAGSQRMTPNGISALYCALDRQTCLSEIRAITGDNVVSGAITPTTQLKLLDLTQLELVEPTKHTLFDEGYRDFLHLTNFLKSMVKKMSKPKGRNDDLSYLSTQVVFEYLRIKFGSQVDGLVFPSVQTGEVGINVVLFPEACVISEEQYYPQEEMERLLCKVTLVEQPQFHQHEKLAFVASSLRFHKIKAIETRADEYSQKYEMFMSDLVRKRLSLI